MKENKKSNFDRQELTPSDIKMIQGLSVLAMVILNLFERLDYSIYINFYCILKANSETVVDEKN